MCLTCFAQAKTVLYMCQFSSVTVQLLLFLFCSLPYFSAKYICFTLEKNTMFIQFKSFCYKLNFFTRVCLGVPFYFSWICKKSVVRILCDMRTAFTLTSQAAFLLIFLNIYLINICFNNIILSLILLILNSIFLIPNVK